VRRDHVDLGPGSLIADIALRPAGVLPLALCLSGNHDPTAWHSWGEVADATYFHNPMAYVDNLARRTPGLVAPPGKARCPARLAVLARSCAIIRRGS
jgi:hypothetical protein